MPNGPGPLVFGVKPDDHQGFARWLEQHRPKYGHAAWFSIVDEAIHRRDWGRAWRVAAHVANLSHNDDYLNAKTSEEAALALGAGEAPGAASPEFRRSLRSQPRVSEHSGATDAPSNSRSTMASAWLVGFSWILSAAVAILFAVFVWPSVYWYDRVTVGDGWSFPVRVNRLNGTAEALLPHVFAGQEEYRLSWIGRDEIPLPTHLVDRLRDNAGFRGNPADEIYNGTGWTLTKLRWQVTSQREGALQTRAYDQRVFIQPNTAALITYPFGIPAEGDSVELTNAWGVEVEPRP